MSLYFLLFQIPLSKEWTKEVFSTQQLLVVDGDSEIWAQYLVPSFLPRFFGVSPRFLVSCYVRGSDSKLLSCRSLPKEMFVLPKSLPLIDWHGAFAFTAILGEKNKCLVCKLDREDQGGLFPAFLMNLTMPKFLKEEVVKATDYIRKNAQKLKSN